MPSDVRLILSSRAMYPTLKSFCNKCRATCRQKELLPTPEPAVIVTSSPLRKPCVFILSAGNGYSTVTYSSSVFIVSQMSVPQTIPSGLYGFADQIQSVSSLNLPATIISFASFNGSEQILALLGENNLAHSLAAFLPASSWSKHKTTLSKFSSHSNSFEISFFAPAAPVLTDTTGNLLFQSFDTLSASISPSVITTIFPLLPHKC